MPDYRRLSELLADSYGGLLSADGELARRSALQARQEFPDEPAVYLQLAMVLTIAYKTDDLFELHRQERGYRESLINARAGLARMENTTYLLRSWRTDAFKAVRVCEGRLHYWMAYGFLLRHHCEGVSCLKLRAMRDHIQRARNLLGEDHDASFYSLDTLSEKVMAVRIEEAQPESEPVAKTDSEWYYAVSDRTHGPLAWIELKRKAENGELQPGDMVWSEETETWICASAIPELAKTGRPEQRSPHDGDPDKGACR